MSEGVFNVVAFGRQTSLGTPVAASTIFTADSGFMGFELDRAAASPDEDLGYSSREYPSRESYGVRWATASLPFTANFENLMHPLEMHVQALGTPTGTASPYTYTYTFNESGSLLNSVLRPYTVEYGVRGSTQDEWRATGVLADTFEFGFDALSAPGNSMWKGTLGLIAVNRGPNSIGTAASVPSTLEVLEGHLTTFSEGDTATAFSGLSAVTGTLKQFSFNSTLNAVGRVYGGSTDTATSVGRSARGEVTFDALLAFNSTTDTNVLDVFEVSGSAATERRWRITVTGSGTKSLTIDFRCRFRAVNVGDHEDERLYAVNGVWVYDSTLGGRGQFILKNGVNTVP